jgi:Zn-dependent peptidase ImmA (M78 family)
MNAIEININRLEHLLKLYRLSREDILLQINRDLKNPLTEKDVFKSEIKLSTLKKIDSIFNKGINYYLDPKEPKVLEEESIFFRKDQFNAELTLGAKQRVTQFEEEKIALSAFAKLSNLNLKRILPFYSVQDNPKEIASNLRSFLYPINKQSTKEILKGLISNLAEYNIFVYEFVDTYNKREKANINGFFLTPNVIVLKRIQKALKREIFTLAHELGHYLLNIEDIDEIIEHNISNASLNTIEKWCNDFAYYFIAGEFDDIISNVEKASYSNDYHYNLIQDISKEIPLSRIAIYTRLVIINKISRSDYNTVRINLQKEYEEYELEKELKKQLDKESGKKQEGRNPVPIISPLVKKTLQSALFEGVISESEFCKRLNIKPEKIENYL